MLGSFIAETFLEMLALCGAVALTVFILALVILLICEKHDWF